jgi:AcrR family transcriptional regulator
MTTTDRKAREKVQRENMILDAAEQVFFSKGFENSTMNDVAECAELSKGSLYNYFKNKNELCIGIVSRSLRVLIKYMEKASSVNGSGLEKLTGAINSFLKFKQENPKYYCALQSYSQHNCGCGKNSKYLNLALSENREITHIMAESIIAGIADGSIKEIDADKTVAALWGDANGLLPGFDLNSNSSETYEYATGLIINGLKK